MCFPYPAKLKAEHAALAEPASVAVRAMRRARLVHGERVAIVGAGTIGLLALQVAKAWGAETVIVLEPEERRRAIAMELGANHALDPHAPDAVSGVHRLTRGLGADVVFECAGTVGSMSMSPLLARKRGRVVLVGLHDAPVPMNLVSLVVGEQELIGSFSHVYDEDFGPAVDLLSAGKITVGPLITGQIGLDDFLPRGLEELAASKGRHLKILVTPQA
jgi:(R,R)-butanediol dehydrogenase/meso-butanediol dehydrogenase/diacetyl reductase